MSTDVVLAVRQMLAQEISVTSLLGSDSNFDTWLFQDKLQAKVGGSGTCAVVLFLDGNWTSPNAYSTAKFPRICTMIYADPARDSAGNLTNDDTRSKILDVHEALDAFLHRPSMETVNWGSPAVRIIGSTRLNEPYPRPWIDTEDGGTAQIFYGLGVA